MSDRRIDEFGPPVVEIPGTSPRAASPAVAACLRAAQALGVLEKDRHPPTAIPAE